MRGVSVPKGSLVKYRETYISLPEKPGRNAPLVSIRLGSKVCRIGVAKVKTHMSTISSTPGSINFSIRSHFEAATDWLTGIPRGRFGTVLNSTGLVVARLELGGLARTMDGRLAPGNDDK